MSAVEDRKRERFWSQLLDLISKGDAVPIVGEELLQQNEGSEATTLYGVLANRYAAECGIELEDALKGNLSATVRRHPSFFTSPFRICQDIAAEYEGLNPPIPEALRQLVRIRHFNLFVSTTFDNLLERALNEERFGGKERTQVIAYAPNNVPADQTIDDALARRRPVVFQLFGSYKTPGQYALTEADMVEYVHSLEANQKKRIVTELYNRTILLLGTSFPDWLTRILLRVARKMPLDDRDQKPVYVADAQVKNDPRLRFFLSNFVANTEVVEESTAPEFVGELSKRWAEQFGSQQADVSPATPAKSRPPPINAVFISYCRSDGTGKTTADAKAAFAIRDGLEARGVEVWLDKDQLQGGDEYERKIERYIKTSSLFIALISETTDARDIGYFRKEWIWAVDRQKYFTGSHRHFLVPVLIGPTDWRPVEVPPEFESKHYVRLPSGQPDAPFLDLVQSLYEKARESDRQ